MGFQMDACLKLKLPPGWENRKIRVKPPNYFQEFQQVGFYLMFCESRGLPCQVTNISHKFLQSQSETHPDGRAFDGSIKGWTDRDIQECIDYMEQNAGHLGAFSASDLKQRVVIFHDVGLGEHLHFQTKRERL